MSHIIHKNEVEYSFVHNLARSFGLGSDKHLSVRVLNLNEKYEVVDHGTTQYVGDDLEMAIDVYNECE